MKILIPTDGSQYSTRAIDEAAKLARFVPKLEVVLLNVRDGPLLYGNWPYLDADTIEAAQTARQDAILAEAQELIKTGGMQVASTERAAGPAAPEIVRVASEHNVDQIVMGTRGLGSYTGALLGSVAQGVAQLSPVPVVLVK